MKPEERFAEIVKDLASELEAVEKENAELKRKLAVANFPTQQATNCGVCGEYKHTPWRDDEHGYMCVTCLVHRYGADHGSVVADVDSHSKPTEQHERAERQGAWI